MGKRDVQRESQDSVSSSTMTIVGGLPPGEISAWPEWAASTGAMPMPVRYTTVEFPALFEKLVLQRLYTIAADTAPSASYANFTKQIRNEVSNFTTGFELALSTYALLKGNEVPYSCKYDTVGDIKKWGNGGKLCKPKCVAEIWPSKEMERSPVAFSPGRYTNLAKAEKATVAEMAANNDKRKQVIVSKNCVGMIVTGLDNDNNLVKEGFFVSPDYKTTKEDHLKDILFVQEVEVIETEIPLPKGDVRFKLRKAPRGYETCLGVGPDHDLLDDDLTTWGNKLKALWRGSSGFDLDGDAFKDKPAEKQLKELQLSELLAVFKEKVKATVYANGNDLRNEDKKFDRAALAQDLSEELKHSCATCHLASSEEMQKLSKETNDGTLDEWIKKINKPENEGLNLVSCRNERAIFKWVGRKLATMATDDKVQKLMCLKQPSSDEYPELEPCADIANEYKAFEGGFHWLYDGIRIRSAGKGTPKCLGSLEGMCAAGTPVALKECDGNSDTVLLMEEFDAKGCAPPTLREKIANMLAEVRPGSCAGYVCPTGGKLKANPETITCNENPCGTKDGRTCCREECKAICYVGTSLNTASYPKFTVPEDGKLYKFGTDTGNHPDNELSYLVVTGGRGCSVTLYEGIGEGQEWTFTGPGEYEGYVGKRDFPNDVVSSIKLQWVDLF